MSLDEEMFSVQPDFYFIFHTYSPFSVEQQSCSMKSDLGQLRVWDGAD